MHTLDKRMTDASDYEVGTSHDSIRAFNLCLLQYKDHKSVYYKDITRLKQNLPEGWLQEREVCINYMTIQNMLAQREGHRFKCWSTFSETIVANVEHPYLLVNNADKALLQGVLEQMGDSDLNDAEYVRLTHIFKRLGVK
jgi:hypothetical protein